MRNSKAGLAHGLGALALSIIWVAPAAAEARPSPAGSWGAFGELAGTCWRSEDEISCYEWEMAGEVLRQTNSSAAGEQELVYRLNPMGDAVVGDDGSRLLAPRAGIVVRELTAGQRRMRVVYRLLGETMDVAVEEQKNGAWTQLRGERRTIATVSEVAEAKAAAEGKRNAYRKDWGVLADLAGRHFVDPAGAAYRFVWKEPGRKLQFWAIHGKATGDAIRTVEHDTAHDRLTLKLTIRFADNWYTYDQQRAVTLTETGVYFPETELMVGLDAGGKLTLQKGEYSAKKKSFDAESRLAALPEATRQQYAAMEERNREVWARVKQRELAAAKAEAERKAQGGGDMFGMLVGAAVGAYAGAAGGFDTGETIGAMMKGASITDPGNPVAGALASTGDHLLTGGGSSAIGSIGGGSAGGSYPTKPNLATGACSGFTEGNYRTRALEGGGDAQLNTMCGQAFEYYTMYKRAIAQGYSEADANRTYAAHEQAARVASGYLSSHGAN